MYAAESVLPEKKEIIFEEPQVPINVISAKVEKIIGGHDLPRVAIIIDDMGFHRSIGKQLIDLPLPLSFSFLPQAPFTQELVEKAFHHKKNILIHLPLEPRANKWDPGKGALYLGELNSQKTLVLENVKAVPHAIGVNNHMGSLYSEDQHHMEGLIQILKELDLFFVDSFTSAESKGLLVAQQNGVKTARRNVFLDNILVKEEICSKLEKLISLAIKEGAAIGIGHPHRETLVALKECSVLTQKSVQLVEVEKLVK
ncbi:MAG: divergent polysaccharide deacetylase family protein [Bacteroidetes bacterium]|nr:divergent polysaccharide deacetylase family protein [Bacteroidota bacterium]